MTGKERLAIEKFLRVADRVNEGFSKDDDWSRRDHATRQAVISWLRSLLNNDEIRQQVCAP
jgi:hypothetical protein